MTPGLLRTPMRIHPDGGRWHVAEARTWWPRPERLEYAEGLVAEAVAELGNGATGEAVAGVARDELVRLSEQVDLLVLGSRGVRPAATALLGASADRIVDGAAARGRRPRGAHEEHASQHAAPAELTAG